MNVLLVDDSRVMRMLMVRAIRRCESGSTCAFYEASNGAEALDEFARHPIDLVITDLHMAELDGLGLIAALKAQAPYLPCGVVTGEAHPERLDRAKFAGAAFIVRKPFTSADWQKALAPFLRRLS